MIGIGMIGAAFGGGVFGALLSATGAFVLFGILGLVGLAIMIASNNPIVLNEIAFGPFFGPHITFAGGVAAAAFAGNKTTHLTVGTDIRTPLASIHDYRILVVGGLFGILGLFINNLFVLYFPPIDTVASTIVISGIIVRFLFGKSGLIGSSDLSKADKEGRYFVPIANVLFDLTVAISLGWLASVTAITLQVKEMAFFISAATLIFLYTNPGGGPVTHHLTISAGVAALHTGSLLFGVIASILAYILGEFIGVRTLNKYQDTHIDPPALAISLTSLIVLNLFPSG